MEIGQAALPCALVALVSCTAKKIGCVRVSEDVRKISIHTMGATFRILPRQMLRLHAIVDSTDLDLGAPHQPLV